MEQHHFTMKSLLSLTLSFAALSNAQSISKKCPGSNICYSMNVPDSSASAGSGVVNLQISGPTSYSWIGMGTGTVMSGSTMFIIYASGSGSNVTLSTRTASGHQQPSASSNVQATLLDGSGISNGMMTANIRCSNCSPSQQNWIFGGYQGSPLKSDSVSVSINKHTETYGTFSFDLSQAKGGSESNPFTSAITNDKTGTSGSSSSSTNACVNQDNTSSSNSTGGSSPGNGGSGSNGQQSSEGSVGGTSSGGGTSGGGGTGGSPIASTLPAGPPFGVAGQGPPQTGFPPYGPPPFAPTNGFFGSGFQGPPGPWRFPGPKSGLPPVSPPMIRRADANNPCGNLNSNRGSNGSKNSPNADNSQTALAVYSQPSTKVVAHAVLACLSFAFLFPVGAISMRLLHIPGLVWIHGGLQLFTAFLFTIAFALGISLAKDFEYMREPHAVIGILVWILVMIQPVFGFLHHRRFKRVQRRGLPSYAHIWLGRLLITVGMINGGLGFLLANYAGSGAIAYGVLAGLVWILYMFILLLKKDSSRAAGQPKNVEAPPLASQGRKQEYYSGK